MKKIILLVSAFASMNAFAQSDSSSKKQDTIRVGNMVIVTNQGANQGTNQGAKKSSKNNGVIIESFNDTLVTISDDTVKVGRIKIVNKREGSAGYGQKNWESILDGDFKKTRITIEKEPKKLKPITTNWWIFDLGFANLVDRTDQRMYNNMVNNNQISAYAPKSTDLRLNNVKSSNVNIWIVQQKVDLYKHIWNLKYGIGVEMFNFRFEQPISFSNTPGNYIYFDNVHFSKNKLFVEYLTVPVQINYQANPQNNKSFYASLGFSAGYLIQSRTKQISEERGKKKVYGSFNLNNFKASTIGEIGIGGVRLYGSYSLSNLFDSKLSYLEMNPFAVGIRFSRF
jgi:hypothetical protein